MGVKSGLHEWPFGTLKVAASFEREGEPGCAETSGSFGIGFQIGQYGWLSVEDGFWDWFRNDSGQRGWD